MTRLNAVILLLLFLTSPGCSMHDERSMIHPYRPPFKYEAPTIDLTRYRSPQQRPDQDPNLSVALAISGGGERAANFAAGVFLGLEEVAPHGDGERNALVEVDYASTVSGGGMAMGILISSMHDYVTANQSRRGYSLGDALLRYDKANPATDPNLFQHLERSFTEVLVNGLFDFLFVFGLDRGDLLEQTFDKELLGRDFRGRSLTLGDIFVRRGEREEEAYHLPMWIANASCYENGAIFPFTPDILDLYQITGYTHNLKQEKFDKDAALDTPRYRRWIDRMPVSVGMTASGNFPGAVPATTLQSRMDPLNPYLHLYDGGLADNLGVLTALEVLRQEQRLDRQREKRVVRRKLLLVIDAYEGTFAPFSSVARSPTEFEIMIRILTISLDSWRGRHRQILREVTVSDDPDQHITTVFFTFEDLVELTRYEELFDDQFTEADLAQLRKQFLKHAHGAETEWSPYLMARSIATSYDVTPAEQRFLLAAGRYSVRRHAKALREALGWGGEPQKTQNPQKTQETRELGR